MKHIKTLHNQTGPPIAPLQWMNLSQTHKALKSSDDSLTNDLCMAASYSDEDGTVHLPYDTVTGELSPEIWEHWLRWNRVRMVPKNVDTLYTIKAIYIDAGKHDQFYLDLGAEAFRLASEQIGFTNVFFELFNGTHSSIDIAIH